MTALGAKAQDATQIYQYDTLGNLVRAWDSFGRDAGWTLDNADNRTQAQVISGAAPPAVLPLPTPPTYGFRVIKTSNGNVAVLPR